MPRILAISSHVAYGAVGLAAMVAPLQRAGLEVSTLPTVVLSNHPGHARIAGKALDPALLAEMTAALEGNGWLGAFDAVLSGYLPSKDHVGWVRAVIERMRTLNPAVTYFCDPIVGDDPHGLYIDTDAAKAVRDTLVPIADVLTPNRFELAWLSGIEVQDIATAIAAARHLARPKLIATSIPAAGGELANILVTSQNVLVCKVKKMSDVPHGTGDLFAGAVAAELLNDATDAATLGGATAIVGKVITESGDSDQLRLGSMGSANAIDPARIEKYA